MSDNSLFLALLGGVGLALVAGPLGCFVIWRRMAYFGDTMAHSALLGVALSVLFGIHMALGVFGVAILIAIALVILQRGETLSADAILGVLSHSTLALGLVLVALVPQLNIDLEQFLFGNIRGVGTMDIVVIYLGAAGIGGVLFRYWRTLLAATVNRELAEAEGLKPAWGNLVLMLLVATSVAIAMKLVGILLITSLLIIPAATARRLAVSPEQMAFFATIIGVLAVSGGLSGASVWGTPAGASIVVAALSLFLLSFLVPTQNLTDSWKDAQGEKTQ